MKLVAAFACIIFGTSTLSANPNHFLRSNSEIIFGITTVGVFLDAATRSDEKSFSELTSKDAQFIAKGETNSDGSSLVIGDIRKILGRCHVKQLHACSSKVVQIEWNCGSSVGYSSVQLAEFEIVRVDEFTAPMICMPPTLGDNNG